MGRSRVVLRYHCRREEREQARVFFFSSRRRHTRWNCDWSSDVCSSDLDVNLSRPRKLADIVESDVANQLKATALSLLHEEAMKSFVDAHSRASVIDSHGRENQKIGV